MFILYCQRAVTEDLRLAGQIKCLCAGLTAVIEEMEHFIDELDILVDRECYQSGLKMTAVARVRGGVPGFHKEKSKMAFTCYAEDIIKSEVYDVCETIEMELDDTAFSFDCQDFRWYILWVSWFVLIYQFLAWVAYEFISCWSEEGEEYVFRRLPCNSVDSVPSVLSTEIWVGMRDGYINELQMSDSSVEVLESIEIMRCMQVDDMEKASRLLLMARELVVGEMFVSADGIKSFLLTVQVAFLLKQDTAGHVLVSAGRDRIC
ncbi:hypothetical protein Tco_0833965 [Tanacetum coccineum]